MVTSKMALHTEATSLAVNPEINIEFLVIMSTSCLFTALILKPEGSQSNLVRRPTGNETKTSGYNASKALNKTCSKSS